MSETVDFNKVAKYQKPAKKVSAVKAAMVAVGGGQRVNESTTQASRRGWKRTGAAVVATALAPFTVQTVGNAFEYQQNRDAQIGHQMTEQINQEEIKQISENGVANHESEAQINQSIQHIENSAHK